MAAEFRAPTAKVELQAKESELYDLRRQLAVAESNRDTARKEREAAKDKKDAMIGTAVGVGVAGVVLSVAVDYCNKTST